MVPLALALALPAGYRSDSGMSARNVSRRSWVARQHFSHNNIDDCPDLAVSAVYSAVTLSSVEDDGLGEEASGAVGALDARASHCQRPGGITRLDPVRIEVRSGESSECWGRSTVAWPSTPHRGQASRTCHLFAARAKAAAC